MIPNLDSQKTPADPWPISSIRKNSNRNSMALIVWGLTNILNCTEMYQLPATPSSGSLMNSQPHQGLSKNPRHRRSIKNIIVTVVKASSLIRTFDGDLTFICSTQDELLSTFPAHGTIHISAFSVYNEQPIVLLSVNILPYQRSV